MGYTHYWRIHDLDSWRALFPRLIKDAKIIIDAAHVELSGPSDNPDWDPAVPVQLDVHDGIDLNGVGSDSHEPFVLTPSVTNFKFCKTARKDYDLVVACILLRAYNLAPMSIKVSSDGLWDEDQWLEPRALYDELFPGESRGCPWKEEEEEEDQEQEDLQVIIQPTWTLQDLEHATLGNAESRSATMDTSPFSD